MAPRQDDEWILTINVILYQSIWDKCLNYFLLSPDESIEMFIFSLRRSAATSHCSVVHTETSENRFFAMPRDTRKRLYITRRSISCLLAGTLRLSADIWPSDQSGSHRPADKILDTSVLAMIWYCETFQDAQILVLSLMLPLMYWFL